MRLVFATTFIVDHFLRFKLIVNLELAVCGVVLRVGERQDVGAILRVFYLNILLNFVIVKILLSLRPIHLTFCVRYLAHTSWTTCHDTRIALRAEAA